MTSKSIPVTSSSLHAFVEILFTVRWSDTGTFTVRRVTFNLVSFPAAAHIHSLVFPGFTSMKWMRTEEPRAAGETASEQMKAFKAAREEGRRLR